MFQSNAEMNEDTEINPRRSANDENQELTNEDLLSHLDDIQDLSFDENPSNFSFQSY